MVAVRAFLALCHSGAAAGRPGGDSLFLKYVSHVLSRVVGVWAFSGLLKLILEDAGWILCLLSRPMRLFREEDF